MSDRTKGAFVAGGAVSRRDLLKAAGGAALCSLVPSLAVGAQAPDFRSSRGRGLIFVVGDGMPLGVVRAMHEISTGVYGNAGSILYRRMRDEHSVLGYVGTRSLSSIVTDSAPASVAWATGSKTMNRMLSSLPDGRPLKTIMELVKEEGYACGLVTTARVTHATPAAWISHRMHRDSEEEIALDYLKFRPDVLLGGGSSYFSAAKRKDGRDLFKEFGDSGYAVVQDRGSLLEQGTVLSKGPLMGAFTASHISYYVDRVHGGEGEKAQPSLAEMTAVALQRLSAHPRGFLLQVEAGRIDHANHSNDAWASILETYEMDMTLGVIEAYLKANPSTLVIVISDHGNAGWGLNGTGPEYSDSGDALKKYASVRASFETMIRRMRGKSAGEIRDIFEESTACRISHEEASMMYDALQPGYKPYPGDYAYQPDATMGKILAHSAYGADARGRKTALVRRGNVGFTSSNHTGEDQMVLAFGHTAHQTGLGRCVENTYLFTVLCSYFGIKYKNPSLSYDEAKQYLKTVSAGEWERHLRLHIA
ncbi:MAG: alkaline phosphatase [Alphaproteobacteria bacterium]|uniref:Alkaline phosphatase n=1 Tax=Candidatus Nitrobium versatile TaxID=2884831 RepID=A0A953M1W8_9BACT|nr:alkaline phosphatase [Candidatus Nitrobium versatile]